MSNDMTLIGKVANTHHRVDITFPTTSRCHFAKIQRDGHILHLDPMQLAGNPEQVLRDWALFTNTGSTVNNGGLIRDATFELNDGRQLQIDGGGDGVSLIHKADPENIVLYWSVDEFHEEAEGVLGAVLGALTCSLDTFNQFRSI
jgi:hypothetical protein